MDYADTNFLVALHLRSANTPLVEKFMGRQTAPLLIGELAELECRGVFSRLTGTARSEAWERLQARLESGSWLRGPLVWEQVGAKARELVDRFAPVLTVGAMDNLHVAAAIVGGCVRFLSFDSASNARVLAACARLKVWPELSAAEKSRLVR